MTGDGRGFSPERESSPLHPDPDPQDLSRQDWQVPRKRKSYA